MIIGLMRHYDLAPVRSAFPALMSSDHFLSYVAEFDMTGARLPAVAPELPLRFAACISSDLPRALDTARHVHSGPIATDEALRELPIAAFTSLPVRLPLFLWLMGGRIAWRMGHPSQPVGIRDFRLGLRAVAGRIMASGHPSVLVVGHGITLFYLARELRSLGFASSRSSRLARGALAVFEQTRC